ncbi:hypothetical protein BN2497_12189 [Janthinobacterium sp. CG23_2]|nr:hypothetical protein BN2497_12189 [Janthinobacterium sp. CG23_2]CUU32492.1 hypothetical protein BN3177_12189 [Janthinobacterium sp. CG23_2]
MAHQIGLGVGGGAGRRLGLREGVVQRAAAGRGRRAWARNEDGGGANAVLCMMDMGAVAVFFREASLSLPPRAPRIGGQAVLV